jgi:hypothetical protein
MKPTKITFHPADLNPDGAALLALVRHQHIAAPLLRGPDADGNFTATLALARDQSAFYIRIYTPERSHGVWWPPLGHRLRYARGQVSAAQTWNNIAAAFYKWCNDTGCVPRIY